jgi:uncharacterized lipoprotein YbaY
LRAGHCLAARLTLDDRLRFANDVVLELKTLNEFVQIF